MGLQSDGRMRNNGTRPSAQSRLPKYRRTRLRLPPTTEHRRHRGPADVRVNSRAATRRPASRTCRKGGGGEAQSEAVEPVETDGVVEDVGATEVEEGGYYAATERMSTLCARKDKI